MTASSFQLPSLPFRTKPFTTGWVWVLCVIGLDYLSSLAYVPSVAFSVAGPLAPLVIAVVVAVTLLLATPLHAQQVDLELVLLADASGSITQAEIDFQRESTATAITDPAVIEAIQNTLSTVIGSGFDRSRLPNAP